ncbi:tRNA lysidine(34) synthetase TilS [Parapusillimonas granuli]|uniref:tRNA(Ile)-lysidine synthase n=1 Tax=Parapusillimonas granuli TaxID=380911 RepID=A0A853FRN4_9BURK|nr:tRNA lysidine(34) synthetase TilS [Parapusillimonas granuli]MBB5213677.1 tRNA(Ile)-lysidine synthase [Parapusillimonas granuli]NYT48514.1 tRNA lysidine(34) synthetase TilS [Parapusillimonas granuli]
MLAQAFWTDFGSPVLSRAIGLALSGLPDPPRRIAVGLSGGADSAMLAVHAALHARRHRLELHFFHVHHGLQAPADDWQARVHDLALMLRVPCHGYRAQVALGRGDGMESAARDARYRAFVELARLAGLRHILLAHHGDDQAETVLLRLLRGAGPAGMAAMAAANERDGLCYVRPWLQQDRAAILEQAALFTQASGWAPVVDPTNADDQYTRAALRERLVPELNARWPGWKGNLLRHARQSAEARQILSDVAAQDFAGLEPSADRLSFSLSAWRALSPPRQALVLRHWLALLGKRMPTDARLQELMRQLRGLHALGHDRRMRLRHGDAWICCLRGRVCLEPAGAPAPPAAGALAPPGGFCEKR